MIKDRQVRQLRRLLAEGETLERAAWKTGMNRKTASKYRNGKLPSELAQPRNWRTRADPFSEVWAEVHEQLCENPQLEAKTLFEWLQHKYPGRFQDGQLRSFQRRVKNWRATDGPAKEVFFSQIHQPGQLSASDFTVMNSLQITIQGQQFDHLLYHFVLTYSNWESVMVCFSESFESLSEGLQNALWQLSGTPIRHRSDRMSAAVNNLSNKKEFTARYEALMRHYDMRMEKTNPSKANENGDVESLHRHLKQSVAQALLLRGSREFSTRDEYSAFINQLIERKNSNRQERLSEELKVLRSLPSRRLESYKRLQVTVNSGSLIRVQRNVYSVNSRLIGESVEIRVFADQLEVWLGQRRLEVLPRLRGTQKHCINYRHVIDGLIRKPGAFENYRYREDLFPTSRFRMTYDLLLEQHVSSQAARRYLAILELAARENESAVDDALRVLLEQDGPIDVGKVQAMLVGNEPLPLATDVHVSDPDLTTFDDLLTDMEVYDDTYQDSESQTDGALAGPTPADIP